MEILVSLSALPPSLYRKYVKGWKPNPTLLKLFEQISGKRGRKAMRIYIDAKTDQVIKNIAQEVKAPEIVEQALREKNIEIVDYIAGTGKDSHGRVVRLGRALKDPVVKKAFDSDPNRKSLTNATKNHQLICISMHPYDIAGMSTDRGWSSCMNLRGGSNRKFVNQDVAGGTLIAYLIEPQDKNINKPIARALAKPYFERTKTGTKQVVGKVNALYLVDYAYPDSTMPFIHTLQEWFDEHINPNLATTERNGMYYLRDKLYADKRSVVHHYDLNNALAKGRYDEFGQAVVAEQTNKSMDPTALKTIVVEGVVKQPKALLPLYIAGYRNVAAYADIVRMLAEKDEQQTVVNFMSAMYADPATSSVLKNKSFSAVIRYNKQLMIKLLKLMPETEREQRADSILAAGDAYTGSQGLETGLNGGYPKALSQVWDIAQLLPDSEKLFWQNASVINAHGTSIDDVRDEYRDKRSWDSLVLSCAVSSLFMREGDSPATLASLKRHKNVVGSDYYECAEAVFDGAVFVALSAREAKQEIQARFIKDTGVNEVFAGRAIYSRNFDYDLVDQEAFEALNLEVIYDFTPRDTENKVLVRTDKTWQEIRAEFLEHAVEIAQEQMQEHLDEHVAKVGRGKSSYNPMVEHVEEDDGIPDMSDDEEDWEAEDEHNWQEENAPYEILDNDDVEDDETEDDSFDDYLEEGEFDRPMTPDDLERLLRNGDDTDEDDIPDMSEEEDDEESERLYAQHMARVRAARST